MNTNVILYSTAAVRIIGGTGIADKFTAKLVRSGHVRTCPAVVYNIFHVTRPETIAVDTNLV